MSPRGPSIALLGCLAGALSCSSHGSGGGPDAAATAPLAPSATASAAPSGSGSSATAPRPAVTAGRAVREGSVVARSRKGDALYVADEDHGVLRVVELPFDPARPARAVPLPGAPAQVVVTERQVLVTLRAPGLLLVFRPDPAAGLVEAGRVELPADAWGLAVTPDGATALVTSAWTHHVTAVDLGTLTRRWSVDVPREPRGVVVRADGAAAYVTHLVGARLTRLDDLAGASPRVTFVELPASPLRAPAGRPLAASLGYSAALSDDGARLFVARHALGALGKEAWFGASTVDVLLTAGDAPLAPRHGKLPVLRADRSAQGDDLRLPGAPLSPFTQPRAVAYRATTRTLLVASEGDDLVAELDALALDPTLSVLRSYPVGAGYDPVLPVASTCAAPAGLALSEDEGAAFVFCRGTYDLAEVRLETFNAEVPFVAAPPRVAHLADEPLDAFGSLGRRLFYSATDRVTSGGLACAGCHPEGRDDGFVWHEAKFDSADGTNVNFVGAPEDVPEEDHVKGVPRRTPMLAGRVASAGPYGWHAESPTLQDRITAGMALHRWGALPKHEPSNLAARAGYLVPFLRKGLVPPPKGEPATAPGEDAGAGGAEVERGRAIFASDAARCARCHVPQTDYSDRTAYPLRKLPKLADFDDEPGQEFKTPQLSFVGGRAPYLHDGSAASLEELVERNGDRMGHTTHLSAPEKAALVAFLRSL